MSTASRTPPANKPFNDAQLLAMFDAKLQAGENPPGVGFVMRGPNGGGLLWWVDDVAEGGGAVLRTTVLPAR